MSSELTRAVVAFAGDRCLAAGPLEIVVPRVKGELDRAPMAAVLIFDAETSEQVEIDFRGAVADVMARVSSGTAPVGRGPGRPRLGVVAREVTLLPRHWAWLSEQPGGSSVALRKLVEAAIKGNAGADAKRRALAAADRFMSVVAGNRPGYEEASRALFGGDARRFYGLTENWPTDIRDHARTLANRVFDSGTENKT